jgi:hypothetical protein
MAGRRINGGIIGVVNSASNTSTKGVWSFTEQVLSQKSSNWPIPIPPNNFIATPTATPAAFGDALEGGFYTGLIFNQVTQSTTSTAIGTGEKTFTTTDSAPLFYSGQTVEVRSRANPSTARMIGTVTASSGTSLTVNVTSVDGSGTLTDWSVMAKFRVIVAPKSSGESSSTQLTRMLLQRLQQQQERLQRV